MSWNPIETCPDGRAVKTKTDDARGCRNEGVLTRSGRIFFSGDMYVYYAPTHWRELSLVEKLRLKNDAEREAINKLERVTKALE